VKVAQEQRQTTADLKQDIFGRPARKEHNLDNSKEKSINHATNHYQ